MVYLAGDNSLTDECVYSLTEMKKAREKAGSRINVIAQFDPKDSHLPTSRLRITRDPRAGSLGEDIIDTSRSGRTEGDGKSRFREESEAAKDLESRIAANAPPKANSKDLGLIGIVDTPDSGPEGGETDTGDPVTLFNFISLGIEKFRAERYMVVLSGHAAGTEENFLLKDDSSARSLTIPKLRAVFKEIQDCFGDLKNEGPVIDILGMDACCMSMAEIAYELKGLVKTVVASESYSPAAGWPYREILEKLEFSFTGARIRGSNVHSEFAKSIVDAFINFYADYTLGGLSVDQAALDVGAAEGLKDVVKELADALVAELQNESAYKPQKRPTQSFKDALLLAHWEAQSYSGELFVDLRDFCECLRTRYPVGKVAKACNTVIEFIKSETFVLTSAYSGPVYQYSHGVSIYFPWASVAPFYKRNLEFATESGWADFLELYTNETRRPPRVERRISRKTAKLLNANSTPVDNKIIDANASVPRRFRQVGEKGADNPIISMRNPPIVFLPDKHIKLKRTAIRAQKKLFLD